MEVSQMRKQQYIATVACLVAGVIGFVSVYATDKGKERRKQNRKLRHRPSRRHRLPMK